MVDATLNNILARARSPQPEDRQMAARELEDQPWNEPVRSTLLELLADPDWRVRRASVETIMSSRRTEWIPEMLDALYDDANAGKRNAAVDILSRHGRAILPYLPRHLQTDNTDVRMFLVTLLGDLRDTQNLSFVSECLQQSDPNLVSAAIVALGKIADPSSVQKLIELLHENNLWYQFQAIEAAGEMRDDALLPHLIPLLESRYCRAAVLKALGRFHQPEAFRSLIVELHRTDKPDPDALHSLEQLLKAPQPEIIRQKDRAWIRSLWTEIAGGREIPDLLGEQLTEVAIQRPQTEDKKQQDPAKLLRAIKAEDPATRRNAIQTMAKNVNPQFREPLMAALADEDPRVREPAALALQAYSSKEVTDALLSTLNDDEVWVRVAIYRSLDAIEQRVSEILYQKLSQENPICQAAILRSLGNSNDSGVVEILLSYLNHEDSEIRASACEGLARFRFDIITERLLEHLEMDPAWNVRLAALQSLKQNQPTRFLQTILECLHRDEDPSVRKEVLHLMKELNITPPPDRVFDFLDHPLLADSAADYLLSCQKEKQQILERASARPPAIRHIVRKIFE